MNKISKIIKTKHELIDNYEITTNYGRKIQVDFALGDYIFSEYIASYGDPIFQMEFHRS